MRRTLTILLTTATIMAVVMWAVSYYWVVAVEVPWLSSGSSVNVSYSVGVITAMLSSHEPPPPTNRSFGIGAHSISKRREATASLHSVGILMDYPEDGPAFEWRRFNYSLGGGVVWSGHTLKYPCWLLVALLCIWPATEVILRLRRRHQPGYCRACGYDLRGSPG